MINTDIVIIDSGVDLETLNRKSLKHQPGINLTGEKLSTDISDSIGHGTAVNYLIDLYSPTADTFIIKIFDNNFSTDFGVLYRALLYIFENISCKIIHMSSGITYCDNLGKLHDICNKLEQKGIILVSAFDNNGAISYPAAFNNVIGVGSSLTIKRITEFEYVENSPINVQGIGTELVVPWLNSKSKNVGGSSFAAPYITSLIFNHIFKNAEYDNVNQLLKSKAIRTVKFGINTPPLFNNRSISRAIIFPYNKEIHSLLRYNELLPFDIVSVYDVKNLGNIGKSVSDIQSIIGEKDWKIRNYSNIEWDSDFDTIILGHTGELSSAIEIGIIDYFLKRCIDNKKNVYCFDSLEKYQALSERIRENGNFCFCPYIDRTFVNNNTFGRLKHIGKPVVAVAGTGTRQGKFTVQLALRSRFIKNGYNIRQLGTEPSAYLFGMDACIPVGYRSTVSEYGINLIKITNDFMGEMEENDAEIILIGTQSNTIPLTTGFTGFYPLYNTDILLGSEPDIVLLCVNYNDDIEYIKRTVRYLESYIMTKVTALILYPIVRDTLWSSLTTKGKLMGPSELSSKRDDLYQKTGIKTYILGQEEEMDLLYNSIIEYF